MGVMNRAAVSTTFSQTQTLPGMAIEARYVRVVGLDSGMCALTAWPDVSM